MTRSSRSRNLSCGRSAGSWPQRRLRRQRSGRPTPGRTPRVVDGGGVAVAKWRSVGVWLVIGACLALNAGAAMVMNDFTRAAIAVLGVLTAVLGLLYERTREARIAALNEHVNAQRETIASQREVIQALADRLSGVPRG